MEELWEIFVLLARELDPLLAVLEAPLQSILDVVHGGLKLSIHGMHMGQIIFGFLLLNLG